MEKVLSMNNNTNEPYRQHEGGIPDRIITAFVMAFDSYIYVPLQKKIAKWIFIKNVQRKPPADILIQNIVRVFIIINCFTDSSK